MEDIPAPLDLEEGAEESFEPFIRRHPIELLPSDKRWNDVLLTFPQPEFDSLVIIIAFFDDITPVSKKFRRRLLDIASEQEDLLFFKAHIEDVPMLAQRYSVRVIPTLLFLLKERVITRMLTSNAEKVERVIAKIRDRQAEGKPLFRPPSRPLVFDFFMTAGPRRSSSRQHSVHSLPQGHTPSTHIHAASPGTLGVSAGRPPSRDGMGSRGNDRDREREKEHPDSRESQQVGGGDSSLGFVPMVVTRDVGRGKGGRRQASGGSELSGRDGAELLPYVGVVCISFSLSRNRTVLILSRQLQQQRHRADKGEAERSRFVPVPEEDALYYRMEGTEMEDEEELSWIADGEEEEDREEGEEGDMKGDGEEEAEKDEDAEDEEDSDQGAETTDAAGEAANTGPPKRSDTWESDELEIDVREDFLDYPKPYEPSPSECEELEKQRRKKAFVRRLAILLVIAVFAALLPVLLFAAVPEIFQV
uniref:Thioredoxin domain-containing protein n=1 Tax=Chromera velia CCMP2878 TaxID=1169474 RepID=A0A0G4GWH3_9ALVE|eukprot:Cvel_23680.t1-p1 / transcript=Cvel_23680.t1 / gene=Cvel_23680 / organism=Chromera_velia_CCMP2878 / gene_product=hypothetical protein / transcript_product=hypothetical protein / location=Cvel_scaffold2468:21957-26403(-) / protein_length=474 / sequence_SO=supercontig / SO=protein_coding / is_pseudo=false